MKYSFESTYSFPLLDKERLEMLTRQTNRNARQTQFLFQLVEGEFEKLVELEEQIKNCFIAGCPSRKTEVEHILSLTAKTNFFKII